MKYKVLKAIGKRAIAFSESEEASVCLNCEKEKCNGNCEELKNWRKARKLKKL